MSNTEKNLPARSVVVKSPPRVVIQQTSIDAVNAYHAAAGNAAAQMAVYAVMCGAELIKIQKQVGRTFVKFVEGNCSFTYRSARKYMDLAAGVKDRALKCESDSHLKLLEHRPSELTPAQSKKLHKAVSEITDGRTLSELYQEFGIIKPLGNGLRGGARPQKKLTAQEKLALDKGNAEANALELVKVLDRVTQSQSTKHLTKQFIMMVRASIKACETRLKEIESK